MTGAAALVATQKPSWNATVAVSHVPGWHTRRDK